MQLVVSVLALAHVIDTSDYSQQDESPQLYLFFPMGIHSEFSWPSSLKPPKLLNIEDSGIDNSIYSIYNIFTGVHA